MSEIKVTIDQAIEELERELAMRKRKYPDWIREGKLHRDRARTQYARLLHALRLLKDAQKLNTGTQKRLFKDE